MSVGASFLEQVDLAFDRAARFRKLLELHRAYGFKDEAEWIEKRLR